MSLPRWCSCHCAIAGARALGQGPKTRPAAAAPTNVPLVTDRTAISVELDTVSRPCRLGCLLCFRLRSILLLGAAIDFDVAVHRGRTRSVVSGSSRSPRHVRRLPSHLLALSR